MNHDARQMTSEDDAWAVWIEHMLQEASVNGCDTKCLLRNCGRACANRKGHVASVSKLKALAADCKTRSSHLSPASSHLYDV